MKGLAADDAAERNRAVVWASRRLRRVKGDRHADGNLERARDADDIVGGACGFKRASGAGEQASADRFIIARLDNEETTALDARRRYGGPARFGHGLNLVRAAFEQ